MIFFFKPKHIFEFKNTYYVGLFEHHQHVNSIKILHIRANTPWYSILRFLNSVINIFQETLPQKRKWVLVRIISTCILAMQVQMSYTPVKSYIQSLIMILNESSHKHIFIYLCSYKLQILKGTFKIEFSLVWVFHIIL